MSIQWSQLFPHPTTSIPSLHNRIIIIAEASSGIGSALASLLSSKHAKEYIAVRSETKALRAIASIKAQCPDSKGQLINQHLVPQISPRSKRPLKPSWPRKTRLDILFNNTDVLGRPQGSRTAQGYELQTVTNGLGPFLFTKLTASHACSSDQNRARVLRTCCKGLMQER